MTRTTFLSIATALMLSAGAGPVSAAVATDCSLQKIVEFPIRMEGLQPTVSAKLNGKDVTLLVDSGAFFSSLYPATAERLGLKRSVAPGMRLQGVGGTEQIYTTKVKEVSLSGVRLDAMEFMVAGRGGGRTDGVLGQNVLRAADVEYDLANGVIRMFTTKGCRNLALAYWAKPEALSILDIQKTSPIDPHLVADATLNGKKIRVMFDTGASLSHLTLDAAQRAGFRMEAEGVTSGGLIAGFGSRVVDTWIAPFESFAIGSETIRNTRLRVGRWDMSDADMLLGADFFLSHRVYVAKSQNKIYFTYNGGPVFRLDQQRESATEIAGADADEPGPVDASAFSRRARASLSRRDFKAAARDFAKAAELEPTNAEHHRDLAFAHLRGEEPEKGLASIEKALELNPKDPRAYILRGQMHLAGKEEAKARADFEAALAAAPDDPQVPLQIATTYMASDKFPEALALLDAWTVKHPKHGALHMVLNQRCWARGLWGRELDRAEADCDAAVRAGPRNSAVLDSRGLVRLRRGDLKGAMADYNAVLKLQPRLAWALYGRGLAKTLSGDTVGGETDMKAGLALDPELKAEAEQHGITPKSVIVAASS